MPLSSEKDGQVSFGLPCEHERIVEEGRRGTVDGQERTVGLAGQHTLEPSSTLPSAAASFAPAQFSRQSTDW